MLIKNTEIIRLKAIDNLFPDAQYDILFHIILCIIPADKPPIRARSDIKILLLQNGIIVRANDIRKKASIITFFLRSLITGIIKKQINA